MNTLQLQFLLAVLAGWIQRSQQDVIEQLQEENRILREQLGNQRLRFTDVQRRRLAAKARKMGRKRLFAIGTLVTPDTLLRWYRRLIAEKYDGSPVRRAGRPKTSAEIERLILWMAGDNPRWGYTRIRGALRNLGHEIGRNTIKRILLENGYDPAPLRRKGMSWNTFLRAHWGAIVATDFFCVEEWWADYWHRTGYWNRELPAADQETSIPPPTMRVRGVGWSDEGGSWRDRAQTGG